MKMLGQHLSGRTPDAACLALRNPIFREAMMHGINLECRYVVMMTKVHKAMELIRKISKFMDEVRAERDQRKSPIPGRIKSIAIRLRLTADGVETL